MVRKQLATNIMFSKRKLFYCQELTSEMLNILNENESWNFMPIPTFFSIQRNGVEELGLTLAVHLKKPA